MAVSEETYRQLALEDPDGQWELHCGVLRRKPSMSFEHNFVVTELFGQLFQQLDRSQFDVRSNAGRVKRSAENYYIPDVYVVPADIVRAHRRQPRSLEAYDTPLPLVIEVWSPSTGDYDVTTKLAEYQRRGDLEIWLFHPYDRVLTCGRRQPDGSYIETRHTSGAISPVALPAVDIELDTLFE